MRLNRGHWLFVASALCVGASYLLERFSYELCHQGLPLTALTVLTPVAGFACGMWSIFHHPSARLLALEALAIVANGYQFLLALILLTGLGIAACG